MSNTEQTTKVTVADVLDYMSTHRRYVSINLTDAEIQAYLNRPYVAGKSLHIIADLLTDYVLANGLADVQE